MCKTFACANNKTQIRLTAQTEQAGPESELLSVLEAMQHIKKFSRKTFHDSFAHFQGFEDDIHTVVIQALTAFDKIFPHVVSKYLTAPPCHYHAHQKRQQLQQRPSPSGQQKGPGQAQTFGQQNFPKNQDNALSSQQQQQQQRDRDQQQDQDQDQKQNQQQWPSNDDISSRAGDGARICGRSSATDNDELLAALLNDFQLQSNRMRRQQHQQQQQLPDNGNDNMPYNEIGPCCVFAISPKLLLNKLRLCHHNKYWLVQNKYAEVISNLNYILLRSYYANFDCAFDKNNNNNRNDNNNDNDNNDDNEEDNQPLACNWREAGRDKDIVCTYEVS